MNSDVNEEKKEKGEKTKTQQQINKIVFFSNNMEQ